MNNFVCEKFLAMVLHKIYPIYYTWSYWLSLEISHGQRADIGDVCFGGLRSASEAARAPPLPPLTGAAGSGEAHHLAGDGGRSPALARRLFRRVLHRHRRLYRTPLELPYLVSGAAAISALTRPFMIKETIWIVGLRLHHMQRPLQIVRVMSGSGERSHFFVPIMTKYLHKRRPCVPQVPGGPGADGWLSPQPSAAAGGSDAAGQGSGMSDSSHVYVR